MLYGKMLTTVLLLVLAPMEALDFLLGCPLILWPRQL